MKIKTTELEQKILSVLTKAGYSEDEAKMVSDVLMFGELSGQPSHGINRLFNGDLNIIENRGEGEIEVMEKSNKSAVIKANKHPGILIGQIGMRKALELAKKESIGIVTTSGTFSSSGCLAYYLEQIALNDYIGILMSQSESFVSPFNSAEPLFGTNPIGFAFPTNVKPLLFDMATSNLTFGTVLNASLSGEKLPENMALDQNGNFTTDPDEVLNGSVLPFDNSYKGSGLGMIVEILAGVLAGSEFTGLYTDEGWGNFFMVLSPELFMPLNQFKARMDEFLKRMKSAKTKDEQKLRLPGVNTLATRDENLLDGEIEIDDEVMKEFSKYL